MPKHANRNHKALKLPIAPRLTIGAILKGERIFINVSFRIHEISSVQFVLDKLSTNGQE